MKGLTARQRDILSFIQTFLETNRYSPSFREIQQHFGFESLSSVHKHIEVLKRKGILIGEKHCGRSLSLAESSQIKQMHHSVELPLIGVVAAGNPIETFAQSQMLHVPENLVHAADSSYLLRVKGDSLQEEFMADGDILILEARQIAYPGEMIIGLINEHDTIIKRYYAEGFYVRLVASNPHLHPIMIHADDIQIQGVVTGLLRCF